MAERISLAEAYNNKDVVTQIAILKDKLDSIPDADLTNVVLKTGDQVIDGEKTFNDPIVANGGVVFANSGIHVNGTLEVDGDIIQNGSAYETHAEQVFTKNDLIVTREDAIGGIAAGQLSGIRVKKYDGVSDLNLGVDASGIMRVGDLGQEQPLATREEAANMTSGALVKWDGVNNKMIAPASNVGDDTHPVKIVNGEVVQVADSLKKVNYNPNTDVIYDNIPVGTTWLTVNLTDPNAAENRTFKLSSLYSDYPQQSGESIYCTDGVRYVDWVLSGYLLIHVYGFGNDSQPHMWINSYHTGVGGWTGWKRII